MRGNEYALSKFVFDVQCKPNVIVEYEVLIH